MKKIFTVAALLLATAVPATSSAESTDISTATRGGADLKVRFVIRSLNNEPKQIRNFRFRNFTVTCNTGHIVNVDGEIERMKINDAGKFDGNSHTPSRNGKVHVEGKVRNNGTAVGILKSSGKFGPGEGCGSKVGWKAS